MAEPRASHVVTDAALDGIRRLAAMLQHLRGPDGCAWDQAQTFASIAPYTIEEAYEVADAIARDQIGDLVDELGDLLLQVVYHATIGADAGLFALADVTEAICAKIARRNPAVFAPTARGPTPDALESDWERVKAAEKPRQSALDDVPLALPALMRADKLLARAARSGIGVPTGDVDATAEPAHQLGDQLLQFVATARQHGVDAEAALRAANRRFEDRFRALEGNSRA